MTQAQPENQPPKRGKTPEVESLKPSPLPEERLAEIRAGFASTERSDGLGDSDTPWLLRYVDMLLKDNEQLRTRRTSFEHRAFTAAILVVGLAVVGAVAYNLYVQPTQDIFAHLPGCTLESIHGCASWVWDYSEHLRSHPR